MTVYEIITTILMVVFGFLSLYIKQRTNIYERAAEAIDMAEAAYTDVKQGGMKMNYAVQYVASFIPAPLRVVFTDEVVQNMIQFVFNSMAQYATKQLDKLVDKVDAIEKTEE